MLFPAAVTLPNVGEKFNVVLVLLGSVYIVELTVVEWNLLNKLNASARNSRFIVSVNLIRREILRSVLTILGARKAFLSIPGIRVDPPAPVNEAPEA